MKPLSLAALDDRWIAPLEQIAGRPLTHRSLPMLVERLSRKYLGEQQELPADDEFAARVLFFLPRDLHKVVAPLGELARAGALPQRPLKILDIGAGVGASTLGILLALDALKFTHGIAQLAWLDVDPKALQRGAALFRAAKTAGLLASSIPEPELHTSVTSAWDKEIPTTEGGWDLIVASNVLTEILSAEDVADSLADELTRATRLTELVQQLVDAARLHPDGSLLLVEPAMRSNARTLQHARPLLSSVGFSVFAPCVHAEQCPLLVRDRDWCHDDLSVDLPPWLVQTALSAGLRYQGLTYSYLTLRKDRQNVRSALEKRAPSGDGTTPAIVGRWVSHIRVSKGKTEIFLCAGPLLQKAQQLDRVSKKVDPESETEAVLSNSTP